MMRCLAMVLLGLGAVLVLAAPACSMADGQVQARPPVETAQAGAAGEHRQAGAPSGPAGDDLLTVAERSGYRATARHEEVVSLLDRIAAAAPKVARRAEIGRTVEGRSIPLLILADPAVSTPEEAAAQVRRGKLVVLMIGNIHAGEVDGKEALPMLAREIATAEKHPLLKDLILIFAPIYNADGNERVSTENRPGQVGPEEGMGIRENAEGLDLNRDLIKLEAPETRALVRLMDRWDPAVFVDTHTTNGSYHGYVLTFEGPKVAAGDARVIEYVRDEMLPRISASVQEKHGHRTFFYGDFAQGHTRWETFPPLARYATNYFGLRNRISILTEGYSYAPYRDRVEATRDFVRGCLEDVAANRREIRKLLDEADARTIQAGREAGAAAGDELEQAGEPDLILRARNAPAPEKVTVLGFVEEEQDGRIVSTGEPREYEIEVWNHTEATLTVQRPYAYLIPPELTDVIENLQRHGIEVEEIREDIELDLEVAVLDTVTRAMRPFQGHHTISVDAQLRSEARRIPAGTVIVRTGQKLGTLAAYMLEAQSEDGLATWNFLDDHLEVGGEYPILRLPREAAILSTAVRPVAEDRKPPRRFTFEEFYESEGEAGGRGRGGRGTGGAPNLAGSPAGGLTWLEDGEHFLQSKAGRRWKVHAATGRAEPFGDTASVAKALAELPAIGERQARSLADRPSATTEDRAAALFSFENDLYYARLDGSTAVRLTSTPEPEELATFSPDGQFIAFVRSNDLYVVDVKTQTERRLTTDGAETILNGKADWVYFEEVFGRNWRTYWWSPDSSRIAFLRTDNSRVPLFTLVDDLGKAQRTEVARYPRPGEPNPTVQLGLVTVGGGGPDFVDLSEYDVDNFLITGVGWWPDSSAVYFFVQNRIQSWLDFRTASPSGSEGKKLFRETTGAWVDKPSGGAPAFLKDGSFIIDSERTGNSHLYHYDRQGKMLGALTEGEWDVHTVNVVENDQGAWVYFIAMRDNPIGRNLYRRRIGGEQGAEIQRLTFEPGSHRVSVSPTGTMFIDTWSSRQTPTQVALRSTEDGSLIRMLDSNPVYALEDFIFGSTEQFQITTKDGFEMEAAWTLPPDFDPERRYPVWLMTYAGPKAPSISDSWGNGGVWDQILANAGIIAFRVDPRSASGKGVRHAWKAYLQFGVPELADLEEAVAWLKTHPWVDGARIGMAGHSYGGFMTAYAMTHSTSFAAGIAGAPVTDWREYDTIYTERYMSTPQENPEGYDRTSAIKAAGKLHGRLLIAHGLLDDNVHPSNTWKFVRALQQANKQFELAIYPANRHGIGGRQYQRLQYDFILRTIGSTSTAPPPEQTPEPEESPQPEESEAIGARP